MVLINPGTGPVENADESVAVHNVQIILDKIKLKGIEFKREPKQDEAGRYGFLLRRKEKECLLRMPGIPILPETRGIEFPRMYVDGCSWMLGIGEGIIEDRLS